MCQTTCSHMFRIDIIDSSSRRKNEAKLRQSLAKVLLLLQRQRHLFNKLARTWWKKGAGEALIPKPLPGCAGRQNDWATAAVLDLCLCPGTPTPPILLLELLCPGKNESCKMPMVSRNAHNFEKFTCWADRRKDTYLPSTKRIRGGGGRPPGHR